MEHGSSTELWSSDPYGMATLQEVQHTIQTPCPNITRQLHKHMQPLLPELPVSRILTKHTIHLYSVLQYRTTAEPVFETVLEHKQRSYRAPPD